MDEIRNFFYIKVWGVVRMRSCGDNLVGFKIRVGRGKFLKIEEIFSKAFVFYDKGRDVLKGVY